MKEVYIHKSKRRISILWFTFSIFLFLLFLIQKIGGHYSDEEKEAWGWMIQNILPSLSLIISILIIDAANLIDRTKKIERFYYRLAYLASFFYLLTVLFTLLGEPFSKYATLKYFQLSELWLAPLQGLVTGILGVFYFKKRHQ